MTEAFLRGHRRCCRDYVAGERAFLENLASAG